MCAQQAHGVHERVQEAQGTEGAGTCTPWHACGVLAHASGDNGEGAGATAVAVLLVTEVGVSGLRTAQGLLGFRGSVWGCYTQTP